MAEQNGLEQGVDWNQARMGKGWFDQDNMKSNWKKSECTEKVSISIVNTADRDPEL